VTTTAKTPSATASSAKNPDNEPKTQTAKVAPTNGESAKNEPKAAEAKSKPTKPGPTRGEPTEAEPSKAGAGKGKTTTGSATTKPRPTPGKTREPAPAMKKVEGGADAVRNRIAALVWLVAVLAAVVLAVGALLQALNANDANSIVQFFNGAASDIDGPFRDVFRFDGDNAETKDILVNWGLAAVAYLIAGKILDRIIRP